jgi:hypothetical protein
MLKQAGSRFRVPGLLPPLMSLENPAMHRPDEKQQHDHCRERQK